MQLLIAGIEQSLDASGLTMELFLMWSRFQGLRRNVMKILWKTYSYKILSHKKLLHHIEISEFQNFLKNSN